MNSHNLGDIRQVLAEAQDIGLVVKLIQAQMAMGSEAEERVESEGRSYRVEGKLEPIPHIEITPGDH